MSTILSFLLVFLGLVLGVLTGLLGLHPNTASSLLSQIGMEEPVFIILPLLVASMFFALIPAIFFSIPDTSIVSVMPGKKLFMAGRGREALGISAVAMLAGIILSILAFPLAMQAIPFFYALIQPYLFHLLFALSAIMILMDAGPKMSNAGKSVSAFLLFLASGLLGLVAFSLDLGDPLFSVFTGFFALPALLFVSDSPPPRQEQCSGAVPVLPGGSGLNYLPEWLAGILFSFVSALLPGISTPAQMATFAGMLLPAVNGERKYLAFICALNGSQAVLSLASLLAIGKARMGTYALFAQSLAAQDLLQDLFLLAFAALASFLAIKWLLDKVPLSSFRLTKGMRTAVAGYLVILSLVLNGIPGLALQSAAFLLGFFAAKEGLRKHLMGAIIIPTMNYFI